MVVRNVNRNKLKSFFIDNYTANNARAWISFIDIQTKTELLKINGRWTSTKEPVNYTTGTVDIGSALLVSRETIPPGEESEISIALKQNGEKECFAFNNESYLHAWKKPDFKLEEKRYIVRVKISAEGRTWQKDFVLLNLGTTMKNFKLQKSLKI